jgi:multidrug efflux system outer membrane protein
MSQDHPGLVRGPELKTFMKRLLLVLAASTLLTACSPQYVPGPEVTTSPHYKQKITMRGETIEPYTKWWANFGDPNLNRLVDEALAANISVEQARERIRLARFNARIVKGSYLPSLNTGVAADVSGSRSNPRVTDPATGLSRRTWTTTNSSNASKTLSGSWTLDFGSKSAAERESANIEASKEALNAVRLDIIAGVASAYLNAQGLGQQIAIAKKSLSVQNDTAEITQTKLEAGSVSALDSTRATANAALTSADIPVLQQSREQAIHQIAVLLGKEPAQLDNLFTKYHAVRRPKVKFSEGIPADLLRNRPDVRQAEWALKAAVADIGVAEADLYPTITLSGSLNARIADGGTKTVSWNFGPSINIPIFDRGRLKAAVDLSKTSARIQYLTYRETVLLAVRDVEDALVALKSERQRYSRLSVAVGELRKAEALARQLNDSGTTEFSEVLDAQSSLYSAELQLAASAQQVAINYVALCQALGGGWDGDEPVKTEDTLKLAKTH